MRAGPCLKAADLDLSAIDPGDPELDMVFIVLVSLPAHGHEVDISVRLIQSQTVRSLSG